MASPFSGQGGNLSRWPLEWVRFLKDFSFDLGFVVLLVLLGTVFVRGLFPRQRILLCIPALLLILAGGRRMPEFWAKPILSLSRGLPQEQCRTAPTLLVVLGGGLAGPDDLAVSTISRVRHAARWMNVLNLEQRRSLKVILSGGPSLPGVSQPESRLMVESFRTWRPDLPEGNILAEANSLNTRENALQVAKMIHEIGSLRDEVALVTSDLHMARAAGAFRAVGLNVCPVPSPGVEFSSEGFLNFRNGERTVRVLNEYAGLAGYRLAGWLKSRD